MLYNELKVCNDDIVTITSHCNDEESDLDGMQVHN